MSARIVALADVYDALTTARPYKEAYSHEKAVNIILRERGKKFDPDIIDVFQEIRDRFDCIRRRNQDETGRAGPEQKLRYCCIS